jgi:hypothetical protein
MDAVVLRNCIIKTTVYKKEVYSGVSRRVKFITGP